MSLIIIVFGVFMALLNGTALFDWFNNQIDPVFWEDTAVPDNAQTFQRFIYGVLGATVAGWGVFLAFIAYCPFRQKEKWAWNCVLAGLLLWFLIDTPISLYFQVAFNAAFNTLLLVSAILPLAFTRRFFDG
ncbi:MAG: hypothetical protein ACE5E7_08455 [Anaerolineae bacterium]